MKEKTQHFLANISLLEGISTPSDILEISKLALATMTETATPLETRVASQAGLCVIDCILLRVRSQEPRKVFNEKEHWDANKS